MADLAVLTVRVDSQGHAQVQQDLRTTKSAFSEAQASIITYSQALQLAREATRLIAGAFQETVGAAANQERAIVGLNAQLQAQGRFSAAYSQGLQEQAGALQKVTTATDDAIERAQTLLLTFPRLSNEVIPRATEATLDLATAMGIDVVSAAQTLGIALNNPVEGLIRLSRIGIRFTEDQKKLIESLVATGQSAKAIDVILGEVSSRFGGRARADAETFGGSITRLGNAFGEVLESVGNVIVQSETFRSGIRQATTDLFSYATRIQDAVNANRGLIEQDVAAVFRAIQTAAGEIPTLINAIGDAARAAKPELDLLGAGITGIGQAYAALPNEVQKLLLTGVGAAVITRSPALAGFAIGAELSAQFHALTEDAGKAKESIDTVAASLSNVDIQNINAAAKEFQDLQTSVQTTTETTSSFKGVYEELSAFLRASPIGVAVAAWDTLTTSIKAAGDAVRDYLGLGPAAAARIAAAGAEIQQPGFLAERQGRILAERVSQGPISSEQDKRSAQQQAEYAHNADLVYDALGNVQGALSSTEVAMSRVGNETRNVTADFSMLGGGGGGGGGGIPKATDALKQFAQTVIEDTNTALESFIAFTKQLDAALKAGLITQERYGRAVDHFLQQLNAASETGKAWAKNQQDIATILEQGRTPAEQYADEIERIQGLMKQPGVDPAVIERGTEMIRQLTEAWNADAVAVRNSVRPVEELTQKLVDLYQLAKEKPEILPPDVLHDAIEKAKKDFADAKAGISSDAKAIQQAVEKIGDSTADALVKMAQGAKVSFRDLLGAIRDDLIRFVSHEFLIDPLVKSITDAIKQARAAADTATAEATARARVAGTGVTGVQVGGTYTPGEAGAQAATTAVQQSSTGITSSFEDITAKIYADFKGLTEGIGKGFMSLLDALGSGLSGILAGLFGGAGGPSWAGFGKAIGFDLAGLVVSGVAHYFGSPSFGNVTSGGSTTAPAVPYAAGYEGNVPGLGYQQRAPVSPTGRRVPLGIDSGEEMMQPTQPAGIGLREYRRSRTGGDTTVIQVPVTIPVSSLDDRSAAAVIQRHMPQIERGIHKAIERGGQLAVSVKRRSGGV